MSAARLYPRKLLRAPATRRQNLQVIFFKQETCVAKLLAFVGSFVGGSIGWWLGAYVGVMTAFMLSMVGTGAGIYLGRRVAAEL